MISNRHTRRRTNVCSQKLDIKTDASLQLPQLCMLLNSSNDCLLSITSTSEDNEKPPECAAHFTATNIKKHLPTERRADSWNRVAVLCAKFEKLCTETTLQLQLYCFLSDKLRCETSNYIILYYINLPAPFAVRMTHFALCSHTIARSRTTNSGAIWILLYYIIRTQESIRTYD